MRSSPSKPDPLDPGPTGFAHRGLHGDGVPENSMAAFRSALGAGAGIECDVRMVGDTTPIIFHDADLKRMCGVARATLDLYSHETLDYRLLGTEECIPRLRDLLQLVRDTVPLLLELKTDNRFARRLCEGVAESLSSVNVRAGVMSFDPRVGQWFADNAPSIRRGIVIGANESALGRWIKLRRSRAEFAAVAVPLVSTRWVQNLRKQIPVYCWTVRTSAERAQAEVQADALIWEGDGRPRN